MEAVIELQTKRLILREYTHADFDALYEILSDAETMKHYKEPYDSDGVRLWIEWNLESYKDFGFGLWAVLLKGQNGENDTFIGDCGITMQRIGRWIRPEIGCHINKKYHRMGLASEAARCCRDYIFDNTPFNTVYSYMTADNAASSGVAVKNGMKLVDEYKDTDGKRLKAYAITREEWNALRT